jgi:hypothetical protein
MKHLRLITGVIALGSLWGFSECIIGAWLRDANLPAGAILTAIVAIGLMTFSKTIFPHRGVPLTMGLIAGTLRYINPVPIGTCIICSAIAIMGEGLLFELLWTPLSTNLKEIKPIYLQSCLGIISGYIIYVGGYLVTQILTPLLSTAGFDASNLFAFIPQILASGLLPAVIGAFTIPAVLALKRLHLTLKDSQYYPLTAATAATSWLLVIINTLILLRI